MKIDEDYDSHADDGEMTMMVKTTTVMAMVLLLLVVMMVMMMMMMMMMMMWKPVLNKRYLICTYISGWSSCMGFEKTSDTKANFFPCVSSCGWSSKLSSSRPKWLFLQQKTSSLSHRTAVSSRPHATCIQHHSDMSVMVSQITRDSTHSYKNIMSKLCITSAFVDASHNGPVIWETFSFRNMELRCLLSSVLVAITSCWTMS